jgi:hypothetical protein
VWRYGGCHQKAAFVSLVAAEIGVALVPASMRQKKQKRLAYITP